MNLATRLARRKRLLVLADFLEKVVAARLDGAKFDMDDWGSTKKARNCSILAGDPEPGPVPSNINATSECGFKGCAIGWAYYSPQLVKAGIRKHISGPDGRFSVEDEALAEFFGIELPRWDTKTGEFERCFMPVKRGSNTGVAGIRRVAAALRKVASQAPPAEKPQGFDRFGF